MHTMQKIETVEPIRNCQKAIKEEPEEENVFQFWRKSQLPYFLATDEICLIHKLRVRFCIRKFLQTKKCYKIFIWFGRILQCKILPSICESSKFRQLPKNMATEIFVKTEKHSLPQAPPWWPFDNFLWVLQFQFFA